MLTTKQLLKADSGFHSLDFSLSPTAACHLLLNLSEPVRFLTGMMWHPVLHGIDRRRRKVEDTVLFPPQYINEEERLPLNHSTLQRYMEWCGERKGDGKQQEGKGQKKRDCGRQRRSVCVCLTKGNGGRVETVISCHGGSEMWQAERKRCSISAVRFSRNQRETAVRDCRRYYWRCAALQMTAMHPWFQQG